MLSQKREALDSLIGELDRESRHATSDACDLDPILSASWGAIKPENGGSRIAHSDAGRSSGADCAVLAAEGPVRGLRRSRRSVTITSATARIPSA